MEAEEYFNLGLEKLKNNNFQGAIEEFNKAIESNPKFVLAYKKRRIANLKLGNFENALLDEIYAHKYGKNISVIFSWIVTFISFCFITSIYFIYSNFKTFMTITFFIVFLSFLIIKIMHKKKPYCIIYPEGIVSLICSGIAIFCLTALFFIPLVESKEILVTNSKQKVDEIQKLLDDNNIPTSSKYFYEGSQYSIQNYNYIKDYDKTMNLLVNSDLLDASIIWRSILHKNYLKGEEYTMRDSIEWLKKIILKIDGVSHVFADYISGNLIINVISDDDNVKTIESINNKVNRFLAHVLNSKNINVEITIDDYIINDDILLLIEAQKYYKYSKYAEAIRTLQKLPSPKIEIKKCKNRLFYKDQVLIVDDDIKLIKKIIEINNEIEKNPTNYELYIKRADIEQTKICDCILFQKAIEDYTKAIEINPKADEAYEKRALLYLIRSPFKQAKTDLKQAASDLEKVVDITGGNDFIFDELGYIYTKLKNKKEAKKWYDTIQDEEKLKK